MTLKINKRKDIKEILYTAKKTLRYDEKVGEGSYKSQKKI